MVEPIGSRTTHAVQDRQVPATANVAPVRAPATPPGDTAAISARVASGPPVDAERVARIRKAIEDGRFPILPATIADRLIALKLNWSPDDAA